jgi:ribosomal protein S18 acetylase RimI-like enzyme
MAIFPTITHVQRERARLYERVRDAYARLRALSVGGWVLQEGEVEVWACPWVDVFNGLMSPRWSGGEAEENWRQAVRLYRSTGQGMFVSLGPSTTAHNLPAIMRRDGFRCSYHVPFMHLELAKLREFPAAPGIRVELVCDFGIFRNQEHPGIGRLNTKIQKRKFQFVREQATAPNPDTWQFIAQTEDGRIVGSTLLFRHNGEGALFDVVVHPDFRRCGIGTQLMTEVSRFAGTQGMSELGLSASGRGIGLYEKVGFVEVGRYSDFFLSKGRVALLS